MIRSLTMLNQSGDTTVTWEAANDDAMLAIIERKMAAGVSFFIAPMTKAGKPDKRKKAQRIDNPEQARAARAVSIPDSDLAKFVSDGLGDVIKAPEQPLSRGTVRRARTAREAVENHTVGVQARRGG
jgi:hypothetical protein